VIGRPRAGRGVPDDTRTRIVSAARELLVGDDFRDFTLEAVANRAAVTRVTVYNQFGSRLGLVEAVFDSLAIVQLGVDRLIGALALSDPLDSLAQFVEVFAHVWEIDRPIIRRLQALAYLDPEFGQVWWSRAPRRRHGLATIATRASAQYGTPPRDRVEDATAALYAVVAFETYDALAGPDRRFEEIAPLVHSLARAALTVTR
jgi:AcrR family transcriptional regulator